LRVELHGLSARHPAADAQAAPALDSADIVIAAGEQVAVIGPSGAGKTTLLHTVACAIKPSAGSLLIGGDDPWRLSSRRLQKLRGQLFLAPQVPPLPPRQRVVTAVLAGRLPHMSLAASLVSLFYPSDIPAAFAALKAFDLEDKLFERVDRLSGGERQRVGLARTLAARASLWLIDEPLSALDPSRATQALDVLVQEARARQVTLVCTLHQVDRALAAFARIIGLRDGKVAFDLPASEVTRERLHALYAQHEDELFAPAPAVAEYPAAASKAVMHCR
jgi:phosphonate transport system ATP-binding protein